MTPTDRELRRLVVREYLQATLAQLHKRRLSSRDLQQLSRPLDTSIRLSRLGDGLPNEITVSRESVATFEDAVDILVAEQAEAEDSLGPEEA